MEHNIRSRLDKRAGSNAELRRRREGSKAFEYHVDCLPDIARDTVLQRHYNTLLQQQPVNAPQRLSLHQPPRQPVRCLSWYASALPCLSRKPLR
ncbi:Phage transposase [Dickeya aquatica]|uniref:Phage transposase n=2 Tax=Dickeya aquatica TaxID=1401087 RepID=A0A375AD07_9GAMM|nr:Phage transposase [Dickeya aquatica]